MQEYYALNERSTATQAQLQALDDAARRAKQRHSRDEYVLQRQAQLRSAYLARRDREILACKCIAYSV
jgi:hypothetical protein